MSYSIKQFFVSLFLVFICANASAADVWQQKFAAADFKFSQNALMYEIPEGGMFKVTPRLKDFHVATHFQIPSDASSLPQWEVTATVIGSDSHAAGVALWYGDKGWTLYIFPNGNGFLRYFEGKKATWTADVTTRNFTYPARLTILRDPNGSILAKINDVIVAIKHYGSDLAADAPEKVTSVSFFTHSTKKGSGTPAVYESLEARAWGERRSSAAKK